MAFACCDRCYEQYLSRDGEIIPENISKMFSVTARVVWRPVSDSFITEMCIKRGKAIPDEPYVIDGDQETKLCTCECHRQGALVLH